VVPAGQRRRRRAVRPADPCAPTDAAGTDPGASTNAAGTDPCAPTGAPATDACARTDAPGTDRPGAGTASAGDPRDEPVSAAAEECRR